MAVTLTDSRGFALAVTEPTIIPAPSDRWEYMQDRRPLPASVESVLTMGLNGDLCWENALFHTMVDTWPKLASNLKTLRGTAGQAPFCVHSWQDGDEKSPPDAMRRRDVVHEALWGMQPVAEKLEFGAEGMFETLAEGCLWGHTVLEPDWEMRKLANGSLAQMPRAMMLVDPLHYAYPGSNSQSKADKLMRYDRHTRTYFDFPDNSFLVQIEKAHRGHPSIAAPLRSLVKYWLGATYGWEWLLTYAQLFGSPFRWINYPAGDTAALSAACAMLANMGNSGWAAMPEGVQLQLMEAQKSGGELPQTLVGEIADLAADLVVLGHTQQTKQNVGSKATEVVRGEVRGATIVNICGRVAATLTQQFVRAVCYRNFGNYDYLPEIRCDMPDASVTKDEIDGLKTLQDMGLSITAEHINRRFGIPKPKKGEEILTPIPVAATAPQPGQKGTKPVKAADSGEAVPGVGQNVSKKIGLADVYELLLISSIADAESRIPELSNAA